MSAQHGAGFVEVADRCFVARYAAWDTTIGAVVGSAGVLVVDTRATLAHGEEIREQVRQIAPHATVSWVVNTHEHFDHVLGNGAFPSATVHAHETAAANLADAVEHIREQVRADPSTDPDYPAITSEVLDGVLTSPIRLPDRVFSSVATIDLGDRYVELLHPGRGHTAGDLLVRVPDADVVFAGDLIEESAAPSYGSDCYPLDWPETLDFLIGVLTPSSVVSPGHGAVVDRGFVEDQRQSVAQVAELVRTLFQQGVPAEAAVEAGGAAWPFGDHPMTSAVERGYAHLRDLGLAPDAGPARSLPIV